MLSACGSDSDPNAGKSDTELLGYIRELQSAIADGYAKAPAGLPKDLAAAFATQSKDLLSQLDKALSDAGSAQPPQATITDNLDVGQVSDLEPFLIGVVNGIVPDLSSNELRLLAYKVGAASAGRMAAFKQAEGKNPSPDAFVLGKYPPGFEGVLL